jgi:hypothetical protein
MRMRIISRAAFISIAATTLFGLGATAVQAQIEPVTPDELDAVPQGHQDIARQLGPVGGNVSGKNSNPIAARARGPDGLPTGGPPGTAGAPPPGPAAGGPGGGPGGPGGPMNAGPPPTPSADPHDLHGYWNGRGAKSHSYEGNERPGPRMRSKYELALLCLVPQGVQPYGGQIYQSPAMITWLTGGDLRARRIYLNAEHPKDLKPTYMGHSVGHWEGDTLVVDTVAMQGTFGYVGSSFHRPGSDVYDQVTKPGQKLPPPTKYFKNEVVMVTPTLHVVERLTKINGGAQLQQDLSFDDPATKMAPYTVQAVYTLGREGEYLEQFCEDGNDKFGPEYAEDASKR